VTALQFDTRKIISATGENGVKVRFLAVVNTSVCLPRAIVYSQVYNRTSMQHSSLVTNGHTQPVERLRYMDRYLVSGGRDAALKIWTL
jgi:mitochondrial division protein 1